MNPEKRLLVVLDLNGTILQRLKTELSLRGLFRTNPSIKSLGNIHGRPVVARPGAPEFLEELLKVADVAVWTSAQPKNALPMVMLSFQGLLAKSYYDGLSDQFQNIFTNFIDHPSMSKDYGSGQLKFLWTQDECDKMPQKKIGQDAKPDFRKNLSKIWSTFGSSIGPENTLMIDDSPKKLSDHVENLLAIPEFDLLKDPLSFGLDETLPRLLAYLKRCAADFKDIRTYLKENRFA